jgi:sortase A
MSPNSLIRWSSNALILAGSLALSVFGIVWAEAWVFQFDESRHFNLAVVQAQSEAPKPAQSTSASSGGPTHVGSVLGKLEIPRIGISTIVLEGVDSATLRRAVGHIPSTAMPDQLGNVGLAGHRNTFFRTLRNIRKDDLIIFKTLKGSRTYRVEYFEVVEPSDIGVLDETTRPTLTLVTCYPFDFIGAAPKRFIVRAGEITAG